MDTKEVLIIDDNYEDYQEQDVDLTCLDHPLAKYPKEIKLQAVSLYMQTASIKKTAEALNLPRNLVHYWVKNSLVQ